MSALRKLRRHVHALPGERLFHYTPYERLLDIITSKRILLADLNVPAGERPAAWFSYHPDWEGTAHKGVIIDGKFRQLGRSGLVKLGGVARIEIDQAAAPHSWAQHRELSGITRQHARELERIAREWRARPDDWRVSYQPVSAEHWLAIEIDFGSGWQDLQNWIEREARADVEAFERAVGGGQ